MSATAIVGIIALLAGVGLFTWPRLPIAGRQCVAVYLISYLFTYCIGGIWIGVTDGDILSSYFRDRLYIPSIADLGAAYWMILLAPLLVPMLIVALFVGRSTRGSAPSPTVSVGRGQFGVLFAALAGYAVFRIFHSGYGLVEALMNLTTLYGDTASIIERRLQLFAPGTGAAFGVVYSALPALCHVALFQARWTRGWRGIAVAVSVVTLSLLLATFQIAPAAVFVAALVMSASRLGLLRMTTGKWLVFATSFVMLLQGLNGWKFGDWTFFENLQHLVFRMPAAFPYYLNGFPRTLPFLGTDWLGAVTGTGADPGSPFVVARYMYPDALSGSAMAAPAHVQAYAEGGLLNAMLAVGALGVLLAAVAQLYRKSSRSSVWHGLYVQGLVAIYYSTQTSFRGLVWHSYGVVWSFGALAVLAALSWRPAAAFVSRRVAIAAAG